MRVIDAILADGFKFPPALSQEEAGLYYKRISKAVTIVVDNVGEYYMSSKEGWDIEEMPNIAPPFPSFFIDWKHNVKHAGDIIRRSFGVLFSSYDMQDANVVSMIREAGGFDVCEALDSGQLSGARWIMMADIFADDGNGLMNLICRHIIPVDKDGKAKRPSAQLIDPRLPKDQYLITEEIVKVSALAISFMHCKNVEKKEILPPAKLNKARIKRGHRALLKYYTLEINPMRKILHSEGRSDVVGLAKAFHICHGHFKEYKDRLLFGKHAGTFWIPSHFRGDINNGKVIKRYDIGSPK